MKIFQRKCFYKKLLGSKMKIEQSNPILPYKDPPLYFVLIAISLILNR